MKKKKMAMVVGQVKIDEEDHGKNHYTTRINIQILVMR